MREAGQNVTGLDGAAGDYTDGADVADPEAVEEHEENGLDRAPSGDGSGGGGAAGGEHLESGGMFEDFGDGGGVFEGFGGMSGRRCDISEGSELWSRKEKEAEACDIMPFLSQVGSMGSV